MKAKPNVTAAQLAHLRAEDEQLRPQLEDEMPTVREEWKQYVRGLTSVVSRHAKEIDEYIQTHGPMTRPEVIERALAKLLSESWRVAHTPLWASGFTRGYTKRVDADGLLLS